MTERFYIERRESCFYVLDSYQPYGDRLIAGAYDLCLAEEIAQKLNENPNYYKTGVLRW